MKLVDHLRILGGIRPHLPAGTTYFVDDIMGGDLLHELGVPRWVVRAAPAGADPTPACQQVGPTWETLETANAYQAWLSGDADRFIYPDGTA